MPAAKRAAPKKASNKKPVAKKAKASTKKAATPAKKAATIKKATPKKATPKKATPKKATPKASAKKATPKTMEATEKKKMEELHPELQVKLAEYRVKRNFNTDAWIKTKCQMFNDYMTKSGLTAAIVSLSGGVDSAVTLGLMKKAKEMKGSSLQVVAGVAQPIHSSAWALGRADECAKKMKLPLYTVDQTALHSQLQGLVDSALGIVGKPFATGQLRSYMRTPVGYYVAQLISQQGCPCVVMGTGNMDEDGYLMYYCKAGDGVVDVQLLADLHKSEVFAVGRKVGVPNSILVAAPSADLWEDQTDEEELGFTYDFVELYTGDYLKLTPPQQTKFVKSLGPEAADQFKRWSTVCTGVHQRNKHKANSPLNLNVL